jgi:hypothetical protein
LVEREKRPVKLDGQVSTKPSLALFLDYEHEFTSHSPTPGNTLVFGGFCTPRIPESTGTKK